MLVAENWLEWFVVHEFVLFLLCGKLQTCRRLHLYNLIKLLYMIFVLIMSSIKFDRFIWIWADFCMDLMITH